MEMEVKFKVIVAIDFGTHGTGLGYAIIDEGKENEEKESIYVEQDWCSNTDNKNKTDILFTHDGKFLAFGDDALKMLAIIIMPIHFMINKNIIT